MRLIFFSEGICPLCLFVLPRMRLPLSALHPMSVCHFLPSSLCERVACKLTQDPASCLSLPLRISFYNISFPINSPVPVDVFRMGPSNSMLGDKVLLTIVSGNEEGYFGVEHQAHGGKIFLRRPLFQPRDFSLTLELRLSRYGNTHLYAAKIALFATNEPSIRP